MRLYPILIAAFALRILLWGIVAFTQPARFIDVDTVSYWNPARALIETGAFARSSDEAGLPETRRTPGYPLFLAAGQVLVGDSPSRVALLQVLIGVATVALTWIAAHAVAGPRAAPIAAMLVAVDPVSIAFSLLLMSESLAALVLMAAVFAGVRLVQTRGHLGLAAATGSLAGATALVRPIGMYLGWPLAFGLLVWAVIERWPRRRALGAASCLLASFLAVVGGWQLRNALVAGFWGLSDVAPEMMLASVAAPILAEREGITDGEALIRLERDAGRDLAAQRRSTLGLIVENPLTFLGFRVRWAIRKLIGPGEQRLLQLTGHWGPNGTPGLALRNTTLPDWLREWAFPPGVPLLAFTWTMAVLAVLNGGLASWLVRRVWNRQFKGPELLVLGVLVYFLAIGPPSSRFRIPVLPLVAILAAAGYVRGVPTPERHAVPAAENARRPSRLERATRRFPRA